MGSRRFQVIRFSALPETFKSVYYHWRKTANYGGYSPSCISSFCEIYTRKYAAGTKQQCEYLSDYRDKKIRQRNSIFGIYIRRIVSFRHTHYTLRKRRIGILISFQHLRIRQRPLEYFTYFLPGKYYMLIVL